MTRPVVIATGGTGGHMFPALALARELQQRGTPVALACDRRGARYVGPDVDYDLIAAASPSGSLASKLRAGGRLALGLGQSLRLLRRRRPGAVAVFGGYASVPVALAALLLRVPVLAHEQNAVLGRANRLIARRAATLALSFETTKGAGAAPEAKRLVSGNPVRPEVTALRDRPLPPLGGDQPLRVTVVGGSQGATVFSEVIPAALARLPREQRNRLRLTQQCRPEDLDRVASAYAGLGFEVELATFFDDLPARLAASHTVISRSGASSVAELLAIGRPALLVPYRFAADDHQHANAEAVSRAGAGWLIAETDLDAEAVGHKLATCLDQPEQLATMAQCARALGRPDAAAVLADAIQAIIAASGAPVQLEALA